MRMVDTSSWIEFLRGRKSEAGLRVRGLLTEGHAGWCELTQVELWNGARGPVEKAALEMLEEEVVLLPIDAPVWKKASSLARKCRQNGLTVPSADIVIAACAAANGLELEHCDTHFEAILPIAKELEP